MAHLIWANVYYKDQFAGVLREEPGARASFSYDSSYLHSGFPAIAYTLPLQEKPFISQSGLHPFFDNLVAEGWMEEAQTRLLGKRQVSRFELLTAFGNDCAGAVSVLDPEPTELTLALSNVDDRMEKAVMASRASLSGVQPKLALVSTSGKVLRPAKVSELSDYIAKFPSRHHDDLVSNEYLSTLAFKALLPHDESVDLWIGEIKGLPTPALIIKRFDREAGNRLHFEEFNQLLGHTSSAKYEAAYKDMADFIRETPLCLETEVYKLYVRILAGLLLGNTDMHLKNFAMFHTDKGLRLTPSYDQVASALYDYKTVALKIGGAPNLFIGNLKASNIIHLGREFGLSHSAIEMAWKMLEQNRNDAKEAIFAASIGADSLKDQLIYFMEKRWNGTFALIGQNLSKRQ